jgi:tRNA nucleotidyltransferase (CCA-adding enzyme)
MRTMVANGEASALISERVWRELEGALGTASPERFFEVLRDCAALPVLLPELAQSSDAALAMHALHAAAEAGAATAVRWAALLAGLHADEVEALCARLRVPNEHRELAVLAARLGEILARRPERAAADAQSLLSLYEKADAFRRPERFAQWLEVLAARHRASGSAAETTAVLQRLRDGLATAAAVQLTPAELRDHRGPQIGALLRERRLAALHTPGS